MKKVNKMLKELKQDKRDTFIDMRRRKECNCQFEYQRGYFQGYEDALNRIKGQKEAGR